MGYEKQFWERPHHDSSEEERLESEIKKLKLKASQLTSKIKERIEFCEGEITWMENVNYNDKLTRTRIYQEQIEFLKSLT